MVGMAERRLRSRPGALATWDEVENGGYVVVGSPETVRQRLEDYAKRVGFGVLVANFSVGNAPSELTRRSMTLFAQEVMPHLRQLNADTPMASAFPAGRARADVRERDARAPAPRTCLPLKCVGNSGSETTAYEWTLGWKQRSWG